MSTTVNKVGNNRQPHRLNIKKSIKERNDSLSISGSELIDLLSPVTPASFTTDYWCRKPLFIKGSPKKLQKLFPGGFERKDFYRAVREAATKKVQGYRLLARKNEGLLPFGNGQTEPYIAIEPHQMEWMIASGANITASSIIDQRAATLAAAIKAQLNCEGEIRLVGTLSPKDNGWPPHIDATSTLLIQCEGRKRFLISEEPVIEWPRWHAVFSSDVSCASYSREMEPCEGI